MKKFGNAVGFTLGAACAVWAVAALAAKPGEVTSGTLIAASESTGACVYTAGTKTACAEVSKSNCDALKGAWNEGQKCPAHK